MPGEDEPTEDSTEEFCEAKLQDGARCWTGLEAGRCPEEDSHGRGECTRCGKPLENCRCSDENFGATPADGGGQADLNGSLNSRIDYWASLRADLRRTGQGQDLFASIVAENVFRGLVALRAAGPALYLGPEHVEKLGGVEALLDTAERSLPMARETDWPSTLRALRSLVEPRRRVARGFRAVARVLGVRI